MCVYFLLINELGPQFYSSGSLFIVNQSLAVFFRAESVELLFRHPWRSNKRLSRRLPPDRARNSGKSARAPTLSPDNTFELIRIIADGGHLARQFKIFFALTFSTFRSKKYAQRNVTIGLIIISFQISVPPLFYSPVKLYRRAKLTR